MVELSLDFDDENIARFGPALEYLFAKYGNAVRVRRSANRGWHIWVRGVELAPEEEIELRQRLGDCGGRLSGDRARFGGGLRTSRLFTVKGRIYGEQKVVRRAGEWLTYDQWRARYGEEKKC